MTPTTKHIIDKLNDILSDEDMCRRLASDGIAIGWAVEELKRLAAGEGEQWVGVSERMPEMYESVLVALGPPATRCTTVAMWIKEPDPNLGEGSLWWSNGGYLDDTVTHWMPFPVPPAAGEGGGRE